LFICLKQICLVTTKFGGTSPECSPMATGLYFLPQAYSEKTQKNNNFLKTKRLLKPKCKLSGSPVFTFSLPGRTIHPSRQLRRCVWRTNSAKATDVKIICSRVRYNEIDACRMIHNGQYFYGFMNGYCYVCIAWIVSRERWAFLPVAGQLQDIEKTSVSWECRLVCMKVVHISDGKLLPKHCTLFLARQSKSANFLVRTASRKFSTGGLDILKIYKNTTDW